jgi:hypothetical protein
MQLYHCSQYWNKQSVNQRLTESSCYSIPPVVFPGCIVLGVVISPSDKHSTVEQEKCGSDGIWEEYRFRVTMFYSLCYVVGHRYRPQFVQNSTNDAAATCKECGEVSLGEIIGHLTSAWETREEFRLTGNNILRNSRWSMKESETKLRRVRRRFPTAVDACPK